jgi:hypothetical protein
VNSQEEHESTVSSLQRDGVIKHAQCGQKCHSEPAKALHTPQALQGLLYLLPVTDVWSENTPCGPSVAQSKVSENFASGKPNLARFVQHSVAETPSN